MIGEAREGAGGRSGEVHRVGGSEEEVEAMLLEEADDKETVEVFKGGFVLVDLRERRSSIFLDGRERRGGDQPR